MTLARADDSVLVVVDIQEKLAPAMARDTRRQVYTITQTLLTAAKELAIPVLVTEQYPKGLGGTVPEVADHFPAERRVIAKDTFSCCERAEFNEALAATGRGQVIIAGMEAHVCVLQTAIQLREAGYLPQVVSEGVCSRQEDHKANALARLGHAGVVVTNVESVLMEWLQRAGTDSFRRLSKLIR